MNGSAPLILPGLIALALATVVLASLSRILWVRLGRAERAGIDQRTTLDALQVRLAQAETAGGAMRLQLSDLTRTVAEEADVRRLHGARVDGLEGGATDHEARLQAVGGDLRRAFKTSGDLAFRLSGVGARLGLALEDADVHVRQTLALAADLDALVRRADAADAAGGHAERRIAQAEHRLDEHADWLGLSHEPRLEAHDERLADLEARARTVEQVASAHERWLGESHEPWLHRHDLSLAQQRDVLDALQVGLAEVGQAIAAHRTWLEQAYAPEVQRSLSVEADSAARLAQLEQRAGAGEAFAAGHRLWLEESYGPEVARGTAADAEQAARLADLDRQMGGVQDELIAYHRWLEQSHEPWLQRHEAALADLAGTLAVLSAQVQADEAALAAHRRQVADAYEPWLNAHELRLTRLMEEIDGRATPREVEAQAVRVERGLEERLAKRIETLARDRVSAESGAREALDLRLRGLAETVEEVRSDVREALRWLGGSHEPWLQRHEKALNRLRVSLPVFISSLESELAFSAEAALDMLGAVQPALELPAGLELDRTRRLLAEGPARRLEARRRGLLPSGEPGPCAGIRLGRGPRPILVVAYSGMQDVFGWLPRLEALGVQVVHLIDTTETWYVEGCDGARSVDEMMDRTREAIAGFDYERIVVIGQSMGGYAALRFGPDLGADLIGVFGPQTHYLQASTLDHGRFLQPPREIVDVRPDLRAGGVPVEVFVSRSERDDVYVWEDHAHLAGLEDVAHIRVHVCAVDDHAVAPYISRQGRMDAVLEALFSLAQGKAPALDLDSL